MPKDGRYFLIELSLREALEEVATGVFEDAWLNDEDAGDICIYYFHKSMFKLYIECPQADYLGQTAININDQQLTENINIPRNRLIP